tara:strand:- start:571 stop:750 length:180 start_codon:yes stop_codon:yes gene_type:complete
MNCWHCDNKLIWGGDHDFDLEEKFEGHEGIVTNLSCSNDKCNTVYMIYHTYDKKKEGKK